MIAVSVLYPNKDNATFDFEYYGNNHIPMIRELLGTACRAIIVERGLSGATPGSKAPFFVLAHLHFNSLESFQSAFGPHAQGILEDIPRFTNTQPLVQISEIAI